MTGTRDGDSRCAQYVVSVHRLVILPVLLLAMLIAAPAAVAQDKAGEIPVAADDGVAPPATPAQETTPTTPEQPPEEEDDPDEEEVGEEVEAPPTPPEPEEEETPPPPPPPAPAPVATPAQLPATGGDERIALVGLSLLLVGFAVRRIARPV